MEHETNSRRSIGLTKPQIINYFNLASNVETCEKNIANEGKTLKLFRNKNLKTNDLNVKLHIKKKRSVTIWI